MTETLVLLAMLLVVAVLPMPNDPVLWVVASWIYALAALISVSVMTHLFGWGQP